MIRQIRLGGMGIGIIPIASVTTTGTHVRHVGYADATHTNGLLDVSRDG